jgi:predicted dehydrogenase
MSLPAPRIIDPQSVPALRWGIIGPGWISEVFVSSIHQFTTQRAVAVASRTPGKADEFAKKYGIDTVHDSYEALVNDPNVDVIYVATHISDHLHHARMAVAAGKHVLVEKPLHYSPEDAEAFFAEATAAGVLAMEAMWTRYLPTSDVLRQLMTDGALGAPELFLAQFGTDNRSIERLWTPGSGGIVFDMGIYPIAFAQFVMGNPSSIHATGRVNAQGMDEESYVTLEYDSGARSHFLISGTATVPVSASIATSTNLVALDAPFFVPTGFLVADKDFYFQGEKWTDTSAVHGHDGLSYQATALASYVAEGRLDSPLHSHADAVANLRVAEEICRQIGANPSGV